MAISATRAVLRCSPVRGNARNVLHSIAYHVSEERVKAGEPWLAWPGERTLMREARCSRTSLRESLARLVAEGAIRDTGERRHRSVIVWEMVPPPGWDRA
jgi:DNA-binding FadR family transcriptional regulator